MSRGSYWRLRVARVEWFTKYCSHKGLRRKHMFSKVFFVATSSRWLFFRATKNSWQMF
jgi:hypothetical protein